MTTMDLRVFAMASDLIRMDALTYGEADRNLRARQHMRAFLNGLGLSAETDPLRTMLAHTLADLAVAAAMSKTDSQYICARAVAEMAKLAPTLADQPSSREEQIKRTLQEIDEAYAKQKEEAGDIPSGWLWSERNQAFHSSKDDSQADEAFTEKWYPSREKFPPREQVE